LTFAQEAEQKNKSFFALTIPLAIFNFNSSVRLFTFTSEGQLLVGTPTVSLTSKLNVDGKIRSEDLTPSKIVETNASKQLVSSNK
jgi:hypothetical protein